MESQVDAEQRTGQHGWVLLQAEVSGYFVGQSYLSSQEEESAALKCQVGRWKDPRRWKDPAAIESEKPEGRKVQGSLFKNGRATPSQKP